jgi:ribulose-5-phosphate 4-epimerase/fuculose-1-phosphate aldolase
MSREIAKYTEKRPSIRKVSAQDFWTPDPVQPTIEAERLHRKQRLAGAFRLFALLGFDHSLAGHITARDPQWLDHFWVNPLGAYFGEIRVSDLVLVNFRGDIVEGDQPVNQEAFAIHSAIHAARPDVVAAAHSHSVHGKAWSALGRLLDPITQDACVFYGDHVLFECTGVALEVSEGERIARTLGPHKAVILRNHGLFTVGPSVEAAVNWFISMDRAAQVQILAESAGKPKSLSHEVATRTAVQVGRADVGRLAFQPLWRRILREQPDFLD